MTTKCPSNDGIGKGRIGKESKDKTPCPATPGEQAQDESLKVKKAQGAEKSADHSTTSVQARFDVFWKAYPRKTGKGAARKVWAKIAPGKELFDSIMSALEAVKQTSQWTKENGQFIPYPTTWLNQSRWEDEAAPELTAADKNFWEE